MAPARPRKTRASVNSVQQPTPPTQDELFDNYNGFESDDPMDKDQTELELERLVFGDDAGFQEGLSSYRSDKVVLSPESRDEALQDGAEDLGGVDDADVSLCGFIRANGSVADRRTSCSSLIQGHPQHNLEVSRCLSLPETKRIYSMTAVRLHGSTVMMSV